MPNATKIEKVRELTTRLKEVEATVFTDYRGLSVPDAAELRSALAAVDAQFTVIKNTLGRIAVKEAQLDGLEAFLEGPTAVAFVKGDPVAAAKAIVDAAKKFPVLEVKGGWSEGRVLTAEDIKALAALESREVMLAKIAGLAKAQMSRTAYLLQALQAKFLAVLEAYKEKAPPGEAPAEEAPAAEAAETSAAEASETPAADQAPGGEGGPATQTPEPPASEAPAEDEDTSEGTSEGTSEDEGEGGS